MRRRRPVFDWAFFLVAALSAGAAVQVYRTEGWAVFADVAREDFLLFAAVLPKVLAGCVIAGLFRLMVPAEIIRRFLGEGSGLSGLAIAVVTGIIVPGGPFTIFPLAAVLLVSGADRGTAAAFVSAWLMLSLGRTIIWELPFLGGDFVALRYLAALPLPLVIGLAVRWLDAVSGIPAKQQGGKNL